MGPLGGFYTFKNNKNFFHQIIAWNNLKWP